MKDFGADPVLEKCDFAGPVKLLRDFQKLPCALDKVPEQRPPPVCHMRDAGLYTQGRDQRHPCGESWRAFRAAAHLRQSVLEAIEKGRVPEQTKIGSDDLLPLFIFALVQASPRCIYSNAELLQVKWRISVVVFLSLTSMAALHLLRLHGQRDLVPCGEPEGGCRLPAAERSHPLRAFLVLTEVCSSFSRQAAEPIHAEHRSPA